MDMDPIKQRFTSLEPFLDERLRRLYAAAEAKALGYGGVSTVARATGVSRRVIGIGLKELDDPVASSVKQIRRPGGGRKRTVAKDATLVGDLEQLIEPISRGDPESPLRWVCKSVRQLAGELNRQGHQVSHRLVAELLQEMGYSLQANRKTSEGASHSERPVRAHQRAGAGLPKCESTGHFGGHQEKGTGG
jgi:transposase